jgi:hypothetical protein
MKDAVSKYDQCCHNIKTRDMRFVSLTALYLTLQRNA